MRTSPLWLLAAAGVMGCAAPPGDETPDPAIFEPDPELGFSRKVLVVTTDYQSGSYAVLDLDLGAAAGDLGVVHPDAVARVAGGTPVIVGRRGADSLTLLDPASRFVPDLQVSVGNGTNPQDAQAIQPGELWVPLYERAAVGVFDAATGEALGEVDLSAFADADGLPEVVAVARVGAHALVAVQRLDRDGGWVPTGPGLLVMVDPEDRSIVDADPATPGLDGIPLGWGNPVGRILPTGPDEAVVLTQGAYTVVGDGGIERIRLGLPWTREVLATEDEAGGSMTAFATVDGAALFAIVNEPLTPGTLDVATVLERLGTGGDGVEVLRTPGYDLADVAVTPQGEVMVADRRLGATGVRIFDAESLAPLSDGPIPTGLAPFSFALLSDAEPPP